MTASGGAVKLCSPNDVVQEILDISGFSSILDVKSSEEDALNDI
jgi:anti-anti-sigma regulatory factor